MRRSRVNRRKDRKIFTRTAARVNVRNLPGRLNNLGGTTL